MLRYWTYIAGTQAYLCTEVDCFRWWVGEFPRSIQGIPGSKMGRYVPISGLAPWDADEHSVSLPSSHGKVALGVRKATRVRSLGPRETPAAPPALRYHDMLVEQCELMRMHQSVPKVAALHTGFGEVRHPVPPVLWSLQGQVGWCQALSVVRQLRKALTSMLSVASLY